MCNLGFSFLLDALQRSGCDVERRFLQDDTQLPAWRGGDLVLFHAAYETDLFLLPGFLRQAGIPMAAEERGEYDPFVILGGPVSLLNVRLVEELLDFICVGEGDETLPSLLETLTDCRHRRLSRVDCRQQLAAVINLFATPLPGRLTSRLTRDPHPAHSVAVSDEYAFREMFLLEISRGCVRRCPFCMVAGCMGCYRPFSEEKLRAVIEQGRAVSRRFGLAGAAAVYHPQLDSLLDEMIERDEEASFSSMYVERITPDFARRLAALGQRTVTLGLESADLATRQRIGKKFSDDVLLAALTELVSVGIQQVKLYVIFGMPGSPQTETEMEILLALHERIRLELPQLRVSWSVNPFVPKPGTPWGHAALPGREYDGVLKRFGRALGKSGKLTWTGLREARLCTAVNRMESTDWSLINALATGEPQTSGGYLRLLEKFGYATCEAELDPEVQPWPEVVVE